MLFAESPRKHDKVKGRMSDRLVCITCTVFALLLRLLYLPVFHTCPPPTGPSDRGVRALVRALGCALLRALSMTSRDSSEGAFNGISGGVAAPETSLTTRVERSRGRS